MAQSTSTEPVEKVNMAANADGDSTAGPEIKEKDISAQSSRNELSGSSSDASDVEAGSGKSDDELVPRGPAPLTGIKLVTVVASVMLAVLCIALDNTILATAIPRITDTFNTIDDISWYGSAYLLSTCSLQLLYARLYTFFQVKWVFLTALFLFEVGSVVCGSAQSSIALVVGRAIAGFGAAGLFTGATTTVVLVAPLQKRPMIAGMIGGMFGFCSIVGPLLGGAFTDKLSWRWCFYINLPIGLFASAGVLLHLRVKQLLQPLQGTVLQRIMRFDPLGNSLFMGAVISLLLAMHWAGHTFPYSDGRIIALFVVSGVLAIAFIGVEYLQRDGTNAIIPMRVAKQRSITFATLFALCLGGAIFVNIYHLPLWFQVTRGVSPIQSAVRTLPLILAQLIGTIMAGILTTKIGHYMPFVWAAAVLMPIGNGLLTTLVPDTATAQWAGYLILLGFGQGFGFQQGNVICQAVLALPDIPIGTALVFSMQFLGGTVFLSVAQNRFGAQLRGNLINIPIPGVDAKEAGNIGATELRALVPSNVLPRFLEAYNDAITQAFQMALVLSCILLVGALGIEWRSVKIKKAT